MRIFRALYFLPSGRLHTTGETIADGGEMEMFCAVSESVWLLCLKLLQRGRDTFKSLCADFLEGYIF